MYIIYKITSPSGKFYIGLTQQPLAERWRQHCCKSKHSKNHPFYNAIRKYGKESFQVEQIGDAKSLAEAKLLEIHHIAEQEAAYNVSPGGEHDAGSGGKKFWGGLTPTDRADFLQKISAIKRANDWSDYEEMSRKRADWQKANPREAYAISHRNLRIANRGRGAKSTPTPEEKLNRRRWRYNRAGMTRLHATRWWAEASEEALSHKKEAISKQAKKRWAAIEDPLTRTALTQTARGAIDRKKQGAAASKGIKNFWEELRKDPQAYAAYIDARRETLKATNERKKHENV